LCQKELDYGENQGDQGIFIYYYKIFGEKVYFFISKKPTAQWNPKS
jgi:hypothetical protein